MKPELVDAAFRRRTVFKRGKNNFEAPTMIDNFQPLERHDISDLLQVCFLKKFWISFKSHLFRIPRVFPLSL